MPTPISLTESIEVFFSYAHEDEELKNELVKHLSILKRQGVITAWHNREITAGTEWAGEIDTHLNAARVILLLISSDFLASDYCYDIELKRAMERHENKEARVIPVILREVDWKGAVFGKLQALPKNAVPVANSGNRDQAFADVAREIRKAVYELEDIIKKLGCHQSTTPTKKSIHNLKKNIFLVVFISISFLILLASILFLLSFYKSQHRFIKNDLSQHRFIENDLSGKCIDVVGMPGKAIRTRLQLWDCETLGRNRENDSATDQQWIFKDGFIMNALSGKCIDVDGKPGSANGTPLQLWDCETSGHNLENDSSTDQRWTFTKDGFIRNNFSNKCIDVDGKPGSANGTPLQLWDCETSGRNLENDSSTDQRWRLR